MAPHRAPEATTMLLAAKPGSSSQTAATDSLTTLPSAKILDVLSSTGFEAISILVFLRVIAFVMKRLSQPRTRALFAQ